jgi:hypothetical protein
MAALIDITGQRFGKLIVIRRAENDKQGQSRWLCRCDCGRPTKVRGYCLRNYTQSCGCLALDTARKRHAQKRPDITGQRFGRLVALERTGEIRAGHVIWKCRCDCGGEIESPAEVLGKRSISCGCVRRERLAARTAKRNHRHGGAVRDARSPVYDCWSGMKQRCLNRDDARYEDYGGRGIEIAPEWINDFQAFRIYINHHLGPKPTPKHSIDRINNDGGYFPGNLRWATPSQQARNQRPRKPFKRKRRIDPAQPTLL